MGFSSTSVGFWTLYRMARVAGFRSKQLHHDAASCLGDAASRSGAKVAGSWEKSLLGVEQTTGRPT